MGRDGILPSEEKGKKIGKMVQSGYAGVMTHQHQRRRI